MPFKARLGRVCVFVTLSISSMMLSCSRPSDGHNIAKALKNVSNSSPAIKAPSFDLYGFGTHKGEYSLTLEDLKGKRTVLAFFCNSSPCMSVALELEKLHKRRPELNILGVMSYNAATRDEFAQDTGITFPVLFDPDENAALAFDAINTPRIFVIGPKGELKYSSETEQMVNAVEAIERVLDN